MSERGILYTLAAFAAAGLVWFGFSGMGPTDAKRPRPTPTPLVQPNDRPKPCPDCKPRPRRAGEDEPAVDLLAVPAQMRKANITSKGLGCCVFRSLEYAARWQNVPALYGMPEWMVSRGVAGGGWPAKVRELIPRISGDRGLPSPAFVQYEGNDPSVIELALKTGRVPCITWNGNHMLSCVHLDASRAAIVDNNEPGRVQWMTRDQFLSRWRKGGGWVAVLLASPPPPPPAGANVRTTRNKDCLCSPLCVCGCNAGRPCHCEGSRPRQPDPEPEPDKPDWPDLSDDDLPERPEGGVDWVYGGVEVYSIGEEITSRAAVIAALSDDTAKLHLTLVGTQQECAAMLAQVDRSESCHVQQYEPGHWALGCGFAVDGPTLYLQAQDGRVLLRTSGAEGLRERLRRVDPGYRPEADPSGMPALPGIDIERVKPYLPFAGAGGAVLALWLMARQKSAAKQEPAPAPQPQPQRSPLDDAALALGRRLLAQQAETIAPPTTPRP